MPVYTNEIAAEKKNGKLAIVWMLLLVLSMSAFTAFSQGSSSFQVDLGLVQNHKGFFKLFSGVMEVGVGYNRKLTGNLFSGASMHLGMLSRKGTTNRLNVYKPSLNLHYAFRMAKTFAIVPQASIGYSILGISNREFDFQEAQAGWNPGAEIRLLWTRESSLDFYLFGRFDAILLSEDETFTKLEYYRKVCTTAAGIGIRIKPGKE